MRPVALITGASAGIGKELARLLAVDHDLILTARREDELNSLAQELSRTRCHVVPLDLASPTGPKALFDAVAAKGLAVDVLINNAGFGDLGPFANAELGKMLRMIQLNVTALTELTGLFLPGMIARQRGQILNVGSVAGFQPGPFMAVYYATKAYVNSFSEALSNELIGTGISVTCLCPGPTRTEFASGGRHGADGAFHRGIGCGFSFRCSRRLARHATREAADRNWISQSSVALLGTFLTAGTGDSRAVRWMQSRRQK